MAWFDNIPDLELKSFTNSFVKQSKANIPKPNELRPALAIPELSHHAGTEMEMENDFVFTSDGQTEFRLTALAGLPDNQLRKALKLDADADISMLRSRLIKGDGVIKTKAWNRWTIPPRGNPTLVDSGSETTVVPTPSPSP